ncbi:phytanoyl-CoA dioxygenase family protein [Dickeya solani]|uniref:Phytanoyl-CoA dioxygenase family protein n=1 Tax=Dickeya solani TaxID=1089444 RepID=A0ABU4EF76_9GAMM|nr:phytanoyl-CoA dioxygenase family protein [Dickeya solani]MCA7001430.1 phytanoyl-CoA dioxygenase family protein [Dickeya solani]MCZ0820927.1 phytanoyl-CoA dioxygenase family protein [Dickeya solani]MDV6996805.1 phytanoyl-CoA dioxygenase family protein [Dickeya solani]MDV7002723.1 phytanoyl-CoA dioxygenase family protein [Dickeya solani]MDV7038627.1 phytanoyl-CoA dioxygenase family protein [Dickeya solani]
MINKTFSVTDSQIADFRKKGFLLLKNFYSPEFTNYIKSTIGKLIDKPTDKYQTGFNRLAFDMYDGDEVLIGLLKDQNFRKTMKNLTGRNMFFAQALSFELEKMKSKGFPWHIGTQSFGYHHAEDYGCTIWAPLVKINPKGQRGGMAYVPKNKINGEYLYSHTDPAVFEMLQNKIDSNKNPTTEDFVQWRDGPLNDNAQMAILNHFGVEDEFEVGDALIFDKYVIHRSIMLGEGEVDIRTAFVMRFFCSESTYDAKRAQDLEIPRNFFKYAGPTKFHLEVAKEEGAKLVNSPLFSGQDYRDLAI